MDAIQDRNPPDSAEMRDDINATRSAMADKLEALEDRMVGAAQSAQATVEDSIQTAKDAVASVKRAFDIKHQVEERPWTIVGGSFLAGLAVSLLIPKERTRSSKAAATHSAIAVRPPQMRPEPTSVFEPFQEEIDKVKGIAIGYVMSLVRDSIKQSVPNLASNIDELMDGITTKLGGEPVAPHSSR